MAFINFLKFKGKLVNFVCKLGLGTITDLDSDLVDLLFTCSL